MTATANIFDGLVVMISACQICSRLQARETGVYVIPVQKHNLELDLIVQTVDSPSESSSGAYLFFVLGEGGRVAVVSFLGKSAGLEGGMGAPDIVRLL
jgi:hypothetical protein